MFKSRKIEKETQDHLDEEPVVGFPVSYALKYPFMYGQQSVTKLTCSKRPTMKTLKRLTRASDDEDEIMNVIFQEFFDIDETVLDKLDAEDGMAAMELIRSTFPKLMGGDT